MNGYERIRAALAGRPPDTVPVMLHNFMLAAREAGISMAEYRHSPEAIARCLAEAVDRYAYDGIVVDVDTATLAGALGAVVDRPEDAPARIARGRLRSLHEPLEPVDIAACRGVQVWLEAVRLLRRYFGDEILIRGNCDQCPFSLASMLRGPAEWMMDLTSPENHPAAHRLLEYCAAAALRFLELMAAAGAHMVSGGDSPAGLVGPRMYRAFAQPYESRVIEAAHARGMPYFLHICGKASGILEDMLTTGADGLELDCKTDARRAHDAMRGRAVFIGNIDPTGVLVQGTPRRVAEATRELITLFSDSPRFVLNAGCAIPPDTPEENLRAMLSAARCAS